MGNSDHKYRKRGIVTAAANALGVSRRTVHEILNAYGEVEIARRLSVRDEYELAKEFLKNYDFKAQA